ncbi:TAXI family TRAP transporter solute-binding subunit [Bacillus tianshenii]|nr:TAXI family TRAP transporter solute-binding subunit [Bacillus tianshenii]
MKKFSLSIIAFILLFAMAGCGGGEGSGGKEFVNVATASTGGTYYPIGTGMANLWSKKLGEEGIKASAQTSAGSVENIDLLRNEEAQFAILQGLIGAQAWTGKGSFEGKKYEGLRSVSMLWPNVEHFVVQNDVVNTGTIEDIEGLNFSTGPQASGTEKSTKVIMEGIGLSFDDINQDHLGYSDAASALKDGRIEGASTPAGVPVTAVTDLYASGADVTVLDITDEQLKSINKQFNTWYRYEIPAETYTGQTEVINTIAQPNFLGTSSEMSKDLVYKLTKTLFENLEEEMYPVHNSAKNIKLESALKGLPAPLHPGAYKYYKEEGLEIPENLIPPEEKEE